MATTKSTSIESLGMDVHAGELYEWIGDHTKTTIQENEARLMKIQDVGK